jgi:hypothetical protein
MLRMSEPKQGVCDFAKRTQLNHVKSVTCDSLGHRKQGISGDIYYEGRSGTRRTRPQHRNLGRRKESRFRITRGAWNKHLSGRELRLTDLDEFATTAAQGRPQDFLIPRAGNQLLHSRIDSAFIPQSGALALMEAVPSGSL